MLFLLGSEPVYKLALHLNYVTHPAMLAIYLKISTTHGKLYYEILTDFVSNKRIQTCSFFGFFLGGLVMGNLQSTGDAVSSFSGNISLENYNLDPEGPAKSDEIKNIPPDQEIVEANTISFVGERRVVGIDIHQELVSVHYRSVHGSEITKEYKEFTAYQPHLLEAAAWIKARNPDVVLMESTGSYWMSPHRIFHQEGIDLTIVNPAHVKGMKGKKTDESDAEWLGTIALVGAYIPSYIVSHKWQELKATSRYLIHLREEINKFRNREDQVFNQAGFRLNLVISSTFGVNAKNALEAILANKSADEVLSRHQ